MLGKCTKGQAINHCFFQITDTVQTNVVLIPTGCSILLSECYNIVHCYEINKLRLFKFITNNVTSRMSTNTENHESGTNFMMQLTSH